MFSKMLSYGCNLFYIPPDGRDTKIRKLHSYFILSSSEANFFFHTMRAICTKVLIDETIAI